MTKTLHSALGMIDARTVAGFVYDTATPGRQFVVEILADDVAIAAVRADTFSPALAASGIADPCHGFILTLPARLAETTQVIAAQLANLATAVGRPVDLDGMPKPDTLLAAAGAVEAVDGLVISGWVKAAPGSAMLMRATTAGEEVAATIARTWTSRSIGGEARPVLAFKLQLPAALADGGSHDIVVTTATGAPLAGSPVKFKQSSAPKR